MKGEFGQTKWEWGFMFSSAFVFYLHIVLTGTAIAGASYSFAPLIGAPSPRLLPVMGKDVGLGTAILLWFFSGPFSLLRHGAKNILKQRNIPVFEILTMGFAMIWAFFLGAVVLEIVFQLFIA